MHRALTIIGYLLALLTVVVGSVWFCGMHEHHELSPNARICMTVFGFFGAIWAACVLNQAAGSRD